MKIKFRDRTIDMKPVLKENNNCSLRYKYELGAYTINIIRYKNDTNTKVLIVTPFDEIENLQISSSEIITKSDILQNALNVISDDIDWRMEQTNFHQQILDSVKTYI